MTHILFATILTAGLASADLGRGWSERGVFVFGSIVLDFRRSVEAWGPQDAALVDCSTDRYFCAAAEIVRIVLPRSCSEVSAASVGTVWTASRKKTVVVARRTDESSSKSSHELGSGELIYLADGARNNVVYEYDRNKGVTAIYYDSSNTINLVGIATKRNLVDLVSNGELDARLHFFGKVTLDPFGLCH